MILVDTSVWISHLQKGNVKLKQLLNDGYVICHPFIVGELACGNLKNRTEIISHLQALPMAIKVDDEEVMKLIENHHLMGKGLGYVDVHLLASALLTEVPIWTFDKILNKISKELGIGFEQ